MIRAGELEPDHLLSSTHEEAAWVRAGEVEELEYYFRLKSREGGRSQESRTTPAVPVAAGAVALTCSSHAGREATHSCARCAVSYCSECVRETRFGVHVAKCCPRCQEPCMKVVKPRDVRPFWRDIPRILRFPLTGGGLIMLFFYGVIGILAQLAPIFGILFYFFLLTYNMLIVQESARGRDRLPDWPDFSSWWEIVARGIKGYVVTIVCLLPLIAFNFAVFGTVGFGGAMEGSLGWIGVWLLGNIVLAAACFIYYPMALGITSVFNTIAPILNPLLVLKAIGRVRMEYAAVLLFFLLSWIPPACVDFALRLGGVPFSGVISAFPYAYVIFAQMHVLGWTLYEAEDRLSWDIKI
jgi:hypothetical protein